MGRGCFEWTWEGWGCAYAIVAATVSMWLEALSRFSALQPSDLVVFFFRGFPREICRAGHGDWRRLGAGIISCCLSVSQPLETVI